MASPSLAFLGGLSYRGEWPLLRVPPQPCLCVPLASQEQALSGPWEHRNPQATLGCHSLFTAARICSLASSGVCENHRVYSSSLRHRVAESCTAPWNQSRLGNIPRIPQTRSRFHQLSEEMWGKDGVQLVVTLFLASHEVLPFSWERLAPFSTVPERLIIKEGVWQEAPAPAFGFTLDQG